MANFINPAIKISLNNLFKKNDMNKNIRAIFFDIDGTLVPFGTQGIPDEVRDCIGIAREKGIKVFISSGRHISWIDNLGDTEYDGYVTANGAMCLLSDRKTCIFRRCINKKDIDKLIVYSADSRIIFAVVPYDGGIFITGENQELLKACKMLNLPPIPIRGLSGAKDMDIVQLMAFGSEEQRSDLSLFSQVLTDCEPTSWNPFFCDIVPKGSDKSVGIDAMTAHFGIELSDTVAFGDGDNDLGMLRHCGTGIAMGNATPAVKLAADYVTTDVTDHGVKNAFHHLGIL